MSNVLLDRSVGVFPQIFEPARHLIVWMSFQKKKQKTKQKCKKLELWFVLKESIGGDTFYKHPHSSYCVIISVSGNCAHFHKGGWWYNACGQANLNGVWYTGGVYRSKFQDGIFWADYGGGFYSMKSVRILIRPIDWGETASQAAAGPHGGRGQTSDSLWTLHAVSN